MKSITLCADDFGMHPSISESIIELAEQQRIQATSAMTTSQYWATDSALLPPLRNRIDVGLHLNLTEGAGLTPPFNGGFPSLANLLIKSHLRLLNPNELDNEIRCQIESFEREMGEPDFIDGHQHVHHLPQVRQALLRVLCEKKYRKLWVRSVAPMMINSAYVKSQVITHSGANQLRHLLKQSSIPTNRAFAGTYSLSEKEHFPSLMSHWLNQLPHGGLIMCHPSKMCVRNSIIDHLAARTKEFNYLFSKEFLDHASSASVKLTQLSKTLLAS